MRLVIGDSNPVRGTQKNSSIILQLSLDVSCLSYRRADRHFIYSTRHQLPVLTTKEVYSLALAMRYGKW